ncbi:MAG: chemotaxis protein CheW [Gemmatimonadaceae bacterium]
MDILQFELAGERYGLPAVAVREIVRAVSIAPLHHAPDVIAGVIDLRGTVVPVIEMRLRFGRPPRRLAPSEHFIIVGTDDRPVALRVDRALEMTSVDDEAVVHAVGLADGHDSVAGVVALADGLTVVHDPALFLSHAENEALDRALTAGADA